MPLLALTLLYGCATDAHGEPDRAHVSSAQAVRDGVVAQDLRAVKQASRRLKRSLRSSSGAGAEAVAAIGNAVDTVEAGEALGRALPHCAACHAREKVTPSTAPQAAPSKSVGQVAAAMRGHGQGAIEMWEGLLFGDLSRVQQGARLIAGSNLVPTGAAQSSPVPPLAAEQEIHVQDLADRVARTDDLASASEAYGRMLGRCAGCHAVMGGGPRGTSDGAP